MDPHNRGPEDHDGSGGRQFPAPSRAGGGIAPRPVTPGVVVPPHGIATPIPEHHDVPTSVQETPGTPRRLAQVVAGDLLLTVNPVDGSEVAGVPRERIPAAGRRSTEQRAARVRAARPAPVAGPPAPELPLLERAEESERLIRLVARGRSVRVTGPSGSGRTALLAAIADRCAGLAPDGVIRLSGYRRTLSDLLQELYAAVFHADGYRPDRDRTLAGIKGIGAIVILDDIEFGGAALEELLGAASECAFLVSATPDVAAPVADSHIEEVFLPSLSKGACAELLARAAERDLTDDEISWAADLWFASEGLPLRFVQAGALLRQRTGGASRRAGQEPRALDAAPYDTLSPVPLDATSPLPSAAGRSALPSLAESAAPAELLAGRLSHNAQEALRVAVALGGECVHQSHLPALVGAEAADAALGELIACGLATTVAGHHRLAAGVLAQLTADGPSTPEYAVTAARHFSWWAGHPSVPAVRVAAEADAILAAMAACRDGGQPGTAVRLARVAAPEFAAGLNWSAWERALRVGQEAARLAGEVGEEAYFHHELGVLALCTGNLDRARTELEASIGMRGAVGDRQGSVVGRRTLALVNDRADTGNPLLPVPVRKAPVARVETTKKAPVVPRRAHALPPGATSTTVTISAVDRAEAGRHRQHRRRSAVVGSRRNLAAAGAGAMIAAVLGTVVTLGATSDSRPVTAKPGGSAAQNDDNTGLPADLPTQADSTSRPPSASGSASASKSVAPVPTATTHAPATTAAGTPTRPAGGTPHPTRTPPTHTPTSPPPATSPPPTTAPPTSPPPTSPPPTTPPPPTGTPTSSTSVPPPTGPSGSPTPSAPPTDPPSAPAS